MTTHSIRKQAELLVLDAAVAHSKTLESHADLDQQLAGVMSATYRGLACLEELYEAAIRRFEQIADAHGKGKDEITPSRQEVKYTEGHAVKSVDNMVGDAEAAIQELVARHTPGSHGYRYSTFQDVTATKTRATASFDALTRMYVEARAQLDSSFTDSNAPLDETIVAEAQAQLARQFATSVLQVIEAATNALTKSLVGEGFETNYSALPDE